jgi:hypothetical protein
MSSAIQQVSIERPLSGIPSRKVSDVGDIENLAEASCRGLLGTVGAQDQESDRQGANALSQLAEAGLGCFQFAAAVEGVQRALIWSGGTGRLQRKPWPVAQCKARSISA